MTRPFILQTDASEVGLGAVLSQQWDDGEHPVLFLSRKLSPAERRYAAIEREALAIRWAVSALRYYLWGAPFSLVTDHAPLAWLNRMKDSNPRLTRWYLELQPYQFNVIHRKGALHANADFFSRQGPWMAEAPTSLLSGGSCDGLGGLGGPLGPAEQPEPPATPERRLGGPGEGSGSSPGETWGVWTDFDMAPLRLALQDIPPEPLSAQPTEPSRDGRAEEEAQLRLITDTWGVEQGYRGTGEGGRGGNAAVEDVGEADGREKGETEVSEKQARWQALWPTDSP